ncbi:hypothetical protein F2Q69_00062098 [Brassica cretica]|uniref:Uncharacterized protein n=1 Tax=Brassica cretica TaxID=69181 RepID=A0A8S9RBV9_BRACR|nr:hypothetical protein F2Q69_00062098 [Brassica cretica]
MNRRNHLTRFDGRSTNPHQSRYNLHRAPETKTSPVKHPKQPYSDHGNQISAPRPLNASIARALYIRPKYRQ